MANYIICHILRVATLYIFPTLIYCPSFFNWHSLHTMSDLKPFYMIRALVTLFVICSCFVQLQAQEIPAPRGCAHDHYVYALDQQYPGFKAATHEVFDQIQLRSPQNDDVVYTIPVVVHVVWKEEAENIADSLINQVMDVLNEDFRRLNADADSVRSIFLDIVGDPKIEFELAAVKRLQTDTTFSLEIFGNAMPDNVKTSIGGGSDAWDPTQYLNIWVCNIQGGSVLGYAYPPADLENWPEGASAPSPELDGVVIHYEVFRRTGTYTASGLFDFLGEQTLNVRGRTVTHEVGHYLGLRHIWGDGLISLLGFPDCNEDDGVSDTPNQGASSQFACDPEQNSCTDDGDNDLPDMFENYMDYSSEDCLNSFTKGQIAIMRSVLENQRSGLIEGQIDTTTTSIAIEQTDAFQVFPNPATDILFINSKSHEANSYQVSLFDAHGRMLQLPIASQGGWQQSLDISNLPAGLYALVIQKAHQRYYQKLLVQ